MKHLSKRLLSNPRGSGGRALLSFRVPGTFGKVELGVQRIFYQHSRGGGAGAENGKRRGLPALPFRHLRFHAVPVALVPPQPSLSHFLVLAKHGETAWYDGRYLLYSSEPEETAHRNPTSHDFAWGGTSSQFSSLSVSPATTLPNFIPQNQVTFRAFRCRSAYRSLLLRRGRAATIIQSAERWKRAFATATDLREQRTSPWEQLWDDDSGRLYFFHKITRSSDDWRQAIDRGWRIRSDIFSPCLTL